MKLLLMFFLCFMISLGNANEGDPLRLVDRLHLDKADEVDPLHLEYETPPDFHQANTVTASGIMREAKEVNPRHLEYETPPDFHQANTVTAPGIMREAKEVNPRHLEYETPPDFHQVNTVTAPGMMRKANEVDPRLNLEYETPPDFHQEVNTVTAPGIMQKMEDSDVARKGASVVQNVYVGDECCNRSTTPTCLHKGGECIPKNETCQGNELIGSKFCVISNLKSCKCCVPIDCKKETLNPCLQLKGTCMRNDGKCDGRTVSGDGFCKNSKTCKCCFPKYHCPCGQDYNGGCKGYRGKDIYNGRCMKDCGKGTIPLSWNTCSKTGDADCQCCASYICPKTCNIEYQKRNYTGICRFGNCLSGETKTDRCPNSNCNCCIKVVNECLGKPDRGVAFTQVGKEYFKINMTRLPWLNAKEACEAEGMMLAEPQDPLGLRKYFTDNSIRTHLWIGGQGNNVNMTWATSGAVVFPIPLNPSVWQTGHPNPITNISCLDLRIEATPGPLASYGCRNSHSFICEYECGQHTCPRSCEVKDQGKTQKGICRFGKCLIGEKATDKCPNSNCTCCIKFTKDPCLGKPGPGVAFTKVGNEYFKINMTRLTWFDAKAACEKEKMILAEPQDPLGLRQYFKDNNISTHLWIGGRNNNVSMNWVSSGAAVFPTPLNPPVWQSGHLATPSRNTSAYCLDLRLEATPGPLAAFSCIGRHSFICEYQCRQKMPIKRHDSSESASSSDGTLDRSSSSTTGV